MDKVGVYSKSIRNWEYIMRTIHLNSPPYWILYPSLQGLGRWEVMKKSEKLRMMTMGKERGKEDTWEGRMKVQEWKSARVLGSFRGERTEGQGCWREEGALRGSHRNYGERQTQEKGLELCEGRENYMDAEGWYYGAPQGLREEGKGKQFLRTCRSVS